MFFHRGKAFLRSDLWEPDTWRRGDSLEEIQAYYGEQYTDGLHRS